MSNLPTALDQELRKDAFSDFYALEMILPNNTIRLIDGAGVRNFPDGRKFTGQDAIFGVLEGADAFRDGFGDSAPSLSFSIVPATDGAIAALADDDNQLAPVNVYYGTTDEATGQVISYSERFTGFFDFAKLEDNGEGAVIDIQAVQWSELYFRTEEGHSLADAFHQSLYPGERGLRWVTGIQRTIVWGPGERPSNLSYRGGSYGYGGSNGGGGVRDVFGPNINAF